MTAWLHIIGVGETGIAALSPATQLIFTYAETVIGPPRFLAELEETLSKTGQPSEFSPSDTVNRQGLEAVARALLEVAEEDANEDGDEDEPPRRSDEDMPALVEWEGGLDRMISQVMRLRETPTVILATGDPMWFGIGSTLAKYLGAEEYEVHPQPSAFQLAAAALRWPLQNVECISLHGRPVETLHRYMLPGSRILALTSDSNTAHDVADLLGTRGFSSSMLTVLENLGGPQERITSAPAVDLDIATIGDFYVLGIDCVADSDASLLPAVPGLHDSAFQSDGQLTKREVRAITLAKLMPMPGHLLWDVGAGSGSVSIEWLRAARDTKAIAFERDPDRLLMIRENATALGVPHLKVEPGEAPASLEANPAPDAVFLGGSVGSEAIFEATWRALKPGGRFVANAVTLDGELALFARQAKYGGELARIDTATLATIGEQRVMRPRMSVLQWSVLKPPQWLSVVS